MNPALDQHGIIAYLEHEKRAIVTDWLRRSTTDLRLARAGHLPDRQIVASIRELVDFLVSSMNPGSEFSLERIASIAESFARVLWQQSYSARHIVLEFGHMRGSFQTALHNWMNKDERQDIEEHLSIMSDILLAQAISVFFELQGATHAAERAVVEDENAKRKFIVNVVGHELRSLLTPIITWIDLLVRQVKTGGPDTLHYVEHASFGLQRSARALKRLIDDLNDYAALSKGRLTIKHVPLDLRALVGDCMESFQPQADKAHIALKGEIIAQPVMVFADETRLQQCLLNLLNNTLKFTPQGGIVCVRLSVHGASAQLEVCDSGSGIAPSEIHLIFEPFQQLESGRAAGGMGLGLAIVKSIVDLHGGNVVAESEGAGRGTTFRITLPLFSGDSNLRSSEGSIVRAQATFQQPEPLVPQRKGESNTHQGPIRIP
ncbi:MAG TPA: HAMP domain-containing sensor histidine kinase [Planctomycetota bacterium]|nr:HAMP domain-containing sensor histidine kinase [Planctomycetota bacterium]